MRRFAAVHVRQLEVQEDEIRNVLHREPHAVAAGALHEDPIASVAEGGCIDEAAVLVVVDQHDRPIPSEALHHVRSARGHGMVRRMARALGPRCSLRASSRAAIMVPNEPDEDVNLARPLECEHRHQRHGVRAVLRHPVDEEQMPERAFFDHTGRRWEVWEVCPDVVERRLARDAGQPPDGVERRRGERRTHLRVPNPLRDGWLAFESAEQRRRLAPVPDRWRALSDDALEALLAEARVVRRVGPPLD